MRWGNVQPRHYFVVAVTVVAATGAARADEIPIITLTEVGPNQEIPVDRSFYVVGDAPSTVANAQAIVVRRGAPGMFGADGPSCHDLLADLRIDVASASATDDDDDEESGGPPTIAVRYDAGVHHAFEVFPRSEGDSRDAEVLISPAWQRPEDSARSYKLLVPHDREFFSTGYGYCLFVVATERAQEIDDATLTQLIDNLARKIVACGDKSSCNDDALAEYKLRSERELATSRLIAAGPTGEAGVLASRLEEAARSELGTASGIVEARDHLDDHWHDKTTVMTMQTTTVWGETSTDPFAQAVATLLARSAALLPQVQSRGKGTSVALFTTDGKLAVHALQVLDDGRSIRVASSRSPGGDQARVLSTSTDALVVTDELTLRDLLELGKSRIHVDKDWVTLEALGDRLSALGLDTWTVDDAAYLVAAHAQMKRLADFVGAATAGQECKTHVFDTGEAEQSDDAVHHHLGEWMVCQHVDSTALTALSEQLGDLAYEDQNWKGLKDKLVAHSRRIVTLTTTAPIATRVSFESRPWVFSYVTPMVGYAGVIRPDESFGMFYFGAQIHLDPNSVDDVLWRDGVTTKDLRRAIALEIGVAPYTGTFGPQLRYSGAGGLVPLFFGAAIHLIPYTSVTLGGTIIDRRNSTLAGEQPHAILAPYVGFTIQLNLPDLIRQHARASTDTAATR